MKNIYICFFIIIVFVFDSCESSSKKNKSDKEKLETFISDSSMLIGTESFVDFFLNKYSDSVNKVESSSQLPFFLKNTQFDYENAGFFSSFHKPSSLRSLIISRVTNCKALQLIIRDSSNIYKKTPLKANNLHIENIELSIYDMAIKQLKILGCE